MWVVGAAPLRHIDKRTLCCLAQPASPTSTVWSLYLRLSQFYDKTLIFDPSAQRSVQGFANARSVPALRRATGRWIRSSIEAACGSSKNCGDISFLASKLRRSGRTEMPGMK